MIRIALPWLVFAYLLVFLAAIFTAWIAYEIVRRFRETRALRHRLQCAICGMIFEDRTPAELPHCPRCGSLTERNKMKNF